MSIGAIVLVVLAVLLLGIVPAWPLSASLSYYPAGGWLLVATLFVVMFLGRRI